MPRYGHITDVFLTNIYNRLGETLTRLIAREGQVVHFNITFSASGSQTVYTPASGKKAVVLGFYIMNTADAEVQLRFQSSLKVIAGLPFKGACAMNLVGLKAPEGSANEAIEINASAATNVRGWMVVAET